MNQYECYSIYRKSLREVVEAETSWDARQAFAAKHGFRALDCVAIRQNVPAWWDKVIR
jgi:hypothetical protein